MSGDLKGSADLVHRPAGELVLGTTDTLPGYDIVELIAQAIVEDPPAAVADGEVIRTGFSSELDELRKRLKGGSVAALIVVTVLLIAPVYNRVKLAAVGQPVAIGRIAVVSWHASFVF